MPTTPTNTFTGIGLIPAVPPSTYPAPVIHVAFKPSITIAAGTLLGKVTATGKYAAYNNANSDGTETAVPLVTVYAITTDASGNVTSLDERGIAQPTGPVYTGGMFRSEDLTGFDAAGMTDIKGVIVTGNLTTGMIKF